MNCPDCEGVLKEVVDLEFECKRCGERFLETWVEYFDGENEDAYSVLEKIS